MAEPWRVTLIDTGDATQTGGRLKRVKKYVEKEDAFCLTYGDGLADIDIADSIEFHSRHNELATMSAVQPAGRWGSLDMVDTKITAFREKPAGDGAWINGGFFILSPKVLDYIQGDETIWEREPLERLAKEGNLNAYLHSGFWQPMDTLRDKKHLEELWESGAPPWKKW
jgi:glucose-1-phosphate cytidylyltransferase